RLAHKLALEIEANLPAIHRFWLPRRNAAVETVRRDEPKVGRNDDCPCGSGKKFKKCCGAEQA
ncbi:MAG: SEC-C metal-binding domain-containing protein, partial [Telluria sp.]